MAIYTIHSRGPELAAIRDALFLRDGFSWGAFWLGPLWFLRHRLYVACAAWIGAIVVLGLVSMVSLPPAAAAAVFLAVQALVGFEADDLRQQKLAAEGFLLVDIVAAKNLDEAEVAFFRRHGTASSGAFPDSEAIA